MYLKKILSIILTLIGFLAYGQQTEVDRIIKEVDSIESDTTLVLNEFNLSELSGILTDGDGIIKVWRRGDQILKVQEEIGFSYGQLETTFYLKDEEVIKIIEIEENFPWTNNEIDLSKLEEVFRIDIFVFGPDKNINGLYDFELKRIGHRVFSDGFCELSDFFSSLDRAEKAIGK